MRRLLQLHSSDNIAIALTELTANELAIVANSPSRVIEIGSAVPHMHKVALIDIAQHQPILRYGQVIGFARQAIQAGEMVHNHNCAMGEIEKDYDFCRLAKPTTYTPLEKRASFQGYRRASGSVGTRNYIGIMTTVNCSATVANAVAQHFTPERLAAWPNVDGVVALTHSGGCGMRSGDEGYDTLQRTFTGYLLHPNFGGVMLLGLGCETMQLKQVLDEAGLNDAALSAFTIQQAGGTRKAIDKGIAAVEGLLPQVNQCTREPCDPSELTLAVQCGGSDGFSGITANPALGVAADLLIGQGGTVIYSETPEIYGAEHLLTQRADTAQVAEDLLARIRWWERYTQKNGFELDNNPSPGNKQGGLTTIIEKSLGAQAKSGSTNLMEVVLYGQRPTKKGLVFMDSPGYDPVSVTGQVASGANIICFTTGRGSAFGFKPAPSLKLASNTAIFEHMEDDMDINCGTIIDGSATLQQVGESIFKHILATASGEKTKSELLGYGNAEFNPWKIGAVM